MKVVQRDHNLGSYKLDSVSENFMNGKVTKINGNILTSFLPEKELQLLLKTLLKNFSASNISFEDLPVDETMKTFFENPSKYLK